MSSRSSVKRQAVLDLIILVAAEKGSWQWGLSNSTSIVLASETERADFVNRIAECASRLNGYNELLEEEANQRLKLNLKLRAYHAQVKERIGQYEADLKLTGIKVLPSVRW
ncbi:hypothetical protein EG68_03492 [Paragonimus skrjabini miyazakii]|uniref:Uncharacterized protein n=1 Tax=Paragonimus skrjabini miyazakii TaxID=59628 RepID=A0A8S9Z0X3_9TREM|nr:hypothetical protein EG68_03492 [Paragonimus skrjabini miyazakii]